MGSKISKAVRPHVRAAASPVAMAQTTNENVNGQDPTPQLPDKYGHDDINLATSDTTINPSQRRNSEPARLTVVATSTETSTMEHLRDRTAAFRLFLEENRMLAIEYADTDPSPPPAPAPALPPVVYIPPPPEEADIQCVICCKQLPKEKDPRHSKVAIKPCKSCESTYCDTCVKGMFTAACKDLTRMPPRCCVQIHLHHARPFLTKEEVTEFKSKYEEWSTPNPFYCPIPTCSVFIPERLLPLQARSKGKQRVDSGVGTPTANTFGCPTCEADICASCRQPAHPNSLCNVAEFGIDAETAELLKSWGYKKCPKCGHGLKRMYGCNHMECRCGAHFCWVCLQSRDICEGGCYDESDNESELYSDVDEPAEPVTQPGATDENQTSEEVSASITATTSNETETSTSDVPATTTPAQPISPPVNLDRGSHRYWEAQELNFGAEPTDDIQDRTWDCSHDFSIHKISLATALTKDASAMEMECVKCWCPVHPEIETENNTREKLVPASAGRGRGVGRGRARGVGRGRARGRGRGMYMPPRGLFRADATVGTAPHLTATISPLSQSVPTGGVGPMEDVQYTEQVLDTYGNMITTTETHPIRRASVDSYNSRDTPDLFPDRTPSVFAVAPPKLSFAYECDSCGLLVCKSCMQDVAPVQEAERKGTDEVHHDEEDMSPSIFD